MSFRLMATLLVAIVIASTLAGCATTPSNRSAGKYTAASRMEALDRAYDRFWEESLELNLPPRWGRVTPHLESSTT